MIHAIGESFNEDSTEKNILAKIKKVSTNLLQISRHSVLEILIAIFNWKFIETIDFFFNLQRRSQSAEIMFLTTAPNFSSTKCTPGIMRALLCSISIEDT